MSEAKVKEPTLREKAVFTIFNTLLNGLNMAEAPVTKEGMVLRFEDKDFVVKVIQKKAPIYQEDVRALFVAVDAEADVAEQEAEFSDAEISEAI